MQTSTSQAVVPVLWKKIAQPAQVAQVTAVAENLQLVVIEGRLKGAMSCGIVALVDLRVPCWWLTQV